VDQANLLTAILRRLLPQTTSPAGISFIVKEEGVVPYAYNDPNGNATFGVGHLLHLGFVTEADRRKWGRKSKPRSLSFVRRVLRADLRRFEAAVREAAGRRLPQHQFDACVSLAFNIGEGAFRRSKVAEWLRSPDVGHRAREAAKAFLSLTKGHPELLRARRERESRLFYQGLYD
jgi:lysozyme